MKSINESVDPESCALHLASSNQVAPIAWGLAVLYALLTVVHPFAGGGEMWLVSLVSTVACTAIAVIWKTREQPANLVYPFLDALAWIAMINTVLHFAIFQEVVDNIRFALLILAFGLTMLSRVSYYFTVGVALLLWTGIIIVGHDVESYGEWGWFLFFAVFVGGVIQEKRIRWIQASGKREHLLVTLQGEAYKAEHLKSLSVLTGGVAHDFNNLLMVILGNIELLQESGLDDVAQKRLKSMKSASERAADLAHQMLAYAGRTPKKTQTIDLAFIFDLEKDAEWTCELLDNMDIDIKIKKGEVYPVEVDPTQILQVVLNLLTNARDSGASKVTIEVGADDGCCWLEVRDNGVGMPQDSKEKIFEPFYTTREMGTGLGLAASRGIVHAHSGRLTVSSEIGIGSQFRMILPRSPNVPSEVDLKNETTSAKIPNPLNNRVLLIEDDPLVADLTIAMLNSSGREVEWFDSCKVFMRELPMLDPEQFELAVIDLSLGDGNGVDVCGAIHSYRPDMPVVLVSGYDANFLPFGDSLQLDDAVEFLAKPYTRDKLQTAMEKVTKP